MRQIIDGKTYNTETATRLCTVSASGCTVSDFQWWQEDLYQTAKGAYFLHGQGGALSKYSESFDGGGRTSGERLEALTRSEAIQWAERRQIDPDELPEDLQPEEA
jgi:hypothetical protein